MVEPERREEHVHEEVEEHPEPTVEPERSPVGYAAIKWTAIVVIVLAILYFLAVFVLPLFARR